ncbi:hypothetical protein FKM82_009489 [Ascaphus truei]
MAHIHSNTCRLLGCEAIPGLGLLQTAAGKKLGMLSASLSRTLGSVEEDGGVGLSQQGLGCTVPGQRKENGKSLLVRDQDNPVPQPKKSHKKVVLPDENGSFPLLQIPKNFICEHCYGAFRSSYHLKRHIYIHTGKEATQCQILERSAVVIGGSSVFLLVLTGERPFECDMCEMKFIQKYHLDRHKRVHSGEKPYQCERCQQAFSRTDRLLKHKRVCQGCLSKAPEGQFVL